MDYKINEFEGPLDLLLHLVRKNELAIKDIKVEEITNQYLGYIKQMKEEDFDIASEYLIMAAELLEIKSKIYLPKTEDETLLEEEDPREELIKKLEAYEEYKNITGQFRELEETRKLIFTNISSLSSYQPETKKSEQLDFSSLLKAFENLEIRKESRAPIDTKVAKKSYSIKKRIEEIKLKIKTNEKVSLEELLDNDTKDHIIVTFLAVLEMFRQKDISIIQKNNFDPIYLTVIKEAPSE